MKSEPRNVVSWLRKTRTGMQAEYEEDERSARQQSGCIQYIILMCWMKPVGHLKIPKKENKIYIWDALCACVFVFAVGFYLFIYWKYAYILCMNEFVATTESIPCNSVSLDCISNAQYTDIVACNEEWVILAHRAMFSNENVSAMAKRLILLFLFMFYWE